MQFWCPKVNRGGSFQIMIFRFQSNVMYLIITVQISHSSCINTCTRVFLRGNIWKGYLRKAKLFIFIVRIYLCKSFTCGNEVIQLNRGINFCPGNLINAMVRAIAWLIVCEARYLELCNSIAIRQYKGTPWPFYCFLLPPSLYVDIWMVYMYCLSEMNMKIYILCKRWLYFALLQSIKQLGIP